MKHKVLKTGLHCITNSNGRVYVFTEDEYQNISWWNLEHLSWWNFVRMRYEI